MKIRKNVYEQIIQGCLPVPPESGGILGGYEDTVDTVYFDHMQSKTEQMVYEPDIETLNTQLRQWQEIGIHFYGMFHTHSATQKELSGMDKQYIHSIMNAMPDVIDTLYFPIVYPHLGMDVFRARKTVDFIFIEKDGVDIL